MLRVKQNSMLVYNIVIYKWKGQLSICRLLNIWSYNVKHVRTSGFSAQKNGRIDRIFYNHPTLSLQGKTTNSIYIENFYLLWASAL